MTDEMPDTIWMILPRFPEYEISNIGQVRTKKRKCKNGTSGALRYLKTQTQKSGYKTLYPHVDGVRHTMFVHRAVLEAFVGLAPEGMEACHNDGDKSNNNIENLRWDTRSQNQKDRSKHGTCTLTKMGGEKHRCAKLTENSVTEIRNLIDSGITQWEAAKIYGVTQPTINALYKRKTWRNVK